MGWTAVVKDSKHLRHDWTVKVDADTVFFPDRLRPLVLTHAAGGNSGTGVYLNNCRFGLHGPIEVLSRNAVIAWGSGMQQCRDHFHRMCSGSCSWGEDLFIDQCLQKVLKSQRIDEFKILLEDHCDHPPDWASCSDTTVAAFHPFKLEQGYRACLNNALASRPPVVDVVGNLQVRQQ